ncbi:MAG: universal stress protein [Nitrospirae bacterium GWC2_42_7]|nr:MAG: universal stress protein [Nitrospirae bacterium GWC2_42_7]
MEDIKRILVVSRTTKYCRKALQYGVSLAKKCGAELYVIHVVHEPFLFGGWNLPMPTLQKEYKKALDAAKKELDAVIDQEKKKGVNIKELIVEGKPTEEILKAVKKQKIDLLVMLAHEEGRFEHFLFGRSNDEIFRKLPCSVLMIKNEPQPA